MWKSNAISQRPEWACVTDVKWSEHRTQLRGRAKTALLGYAERDVIMDNVPQSGVRVRASKKVLLDCCNSQWNTLPRLLPLRIWRVCVRKLLNWQSDKNPHFTQCPGVPRCEINIRWVFFFSLHTTASVPVCSCLITQECFKDFCSRGQESPKKLIRAAFLLIVRWSATSGGRCGYHGSKWGGQVSIKGDEEMRTGRMDGPTNTALLPRRPLFMSSHSHEVRQFETRVMSLPLVFWCTTLFGLSWTHQKSGQSCLSQSYVVIDSSLSIHLHVVIVAMITGELINRNGWSCQYLTFSGNRLPGALYSM